MTHRILRPQEVVGGVRAGSCARPEAAVEQDRRGADRRATEAAVTGVHQT